MNKSIHRQPDEPANSNAEVDGEIEVDVHSRYEQFDSDPHAERYVSSYTITILNNGSDTVKLLSRHWSITNARGDVDQVEGEGVVGQQPCLRPGESFQYTSGAMLNTAVGSMGGYYTMSRDDGDEFRVEIPEFILGIRETLH